MVSDFCSSAHNLSLVQREALHFKVYFCDFAHVELFFLLLSFISFCGQLLFFGTTEEVVKDFANLIDASSFASTFSEQDASSSLNRLL